MVKFGNTINNMTSRDFCYWLQGFFEIGRQTSIDQIQTQQIKNHLNLVFKHEIDPSIDLNNSKVKDELQKIHDGTIHKPVFESKAAEDSFGKTYRC